MSMTKSAANFVHALAAVVGGNVLYFLTEKYLPERAQHVPFKTDLGTLVDFFFCLVIFGAIKTVAGKSGESR